MPYYLSIGMTADEYWHGHPILVKSYREAYILRVRQQNYLAWLSGSYTHNAVAVAVANTFGKKNGKKYDYPKEPFEIGMDTEAEKEAKAQKAREKIVANLNAWKDAWDRQHKKSGENQ